MEELFGSDEFGISNEVIGFTSSCVLHIDGSPNGGDSVSPLLSHGEPSVTPFSDCELVAQRRVAPPIILRQASSLDDLLEFARLHVPSPLERPGVSCNAIVSGASSACNTMVSGAFQHGTCSNGGLQNGRALVNEILHHPSTLMRPSPLGYDEASASDLGFHEASASDPWAPFVTRSLPASPTVDRVDKGGEEPDVVRPVCPSPSERQPSPSRALVRVQSSFSKSKRLRTEPPYMAQPRLPISTRTRSVTDESTGPRSGLKSYDMPIPPELPGHVPRSSHPVHATRIETEDYTGRVTVERAMRLMTPSMTARILQVRTNEVTQINVSQWRDQVSINLKKSCGVSLRNACVACESLALFCKENFGLDLVDFGASPGLISIYLSAHCAPTMPAHRLTSLKTAQARLGADLDARHESLKPFSARIRKGGHAPSASLKMVCHLLHMAKRGSTIYIRAYSAAFALMALTSLRWIDAIRSPPPSRSRDSQRDAWQGRAFQAKTDKHSPMFWWSPILDLFGDESWSDAIFFVFKDRPGADYLFPDFCGVSIGVATGWSLGPASKATCVAAYRFILQLPPLSMSTSAIKTSARLHGLRRIIPIVARTLSGVLGLSQNDRCELGRWVQALCGESGAPARLVHARSMPNIYSEEAHRPVAIDVREKVVGALRRYFKAFPDWNSLPETDDFLVLLPYFTRDGHVSLPIITGPEPEPDALELEDDE